MWLNLLALLMLVLITFFQSMQGTFSALILFVLAVISSATAFAFYEDLYSGLLAQWMPGEGEAVSLAAIFLVALLALRLAADLGLKGDVPLPGKIDKAGGAVLGFLAAMVMTGTAMTAVQMLPYDREVLGHKRYTGQVVAGRPVESGLFLSPDGFATGLAGIILDGSWSGKDAEDSFAANHPDILGEFDARRSAGPLSKGVNGNSVKVQQVWWPDRLAGNIDPDSGMKLLGVRVTASGASSFTPAQFRLVVRDGGRIRQYMPKGAGDGTELPGEVELLAAYSLPKTTLDLVYQVPASTNDPWYVTFNGKAKGEITEQMLKDAATPSFSGSGSATPAATEQKESAKPAEPSGSAEAPKKPSISGGRTHGANLSDDPYVSDDLPGLINIPTNEAGAVELAGKKIVSGHLVVDASRVKGNFAAVASVTKFNVPTGQRLVQVPLQKVFAESIPGQALNLADRTFQQNWSLRDDAGKTYFPVGAFAQATAGGTEIIEIQYNATQENILAGHTLGPWQRIQNNDFRQPDAQLIFLYLVPPNTHIVGFQTNRGGTTEIDLLVQ